MQNAPGTRLSLLVMSRAGVFTFPLPDAGEVTVGRGPECHVRIDDPKVSRCHVRLRMGNVPSLLDPGSANGTFRRGQRLESNVPVDLTVGDMITVGATALVLQASIADAPVRVWSQGVFEARVAEEEGRAREGGPGHAVIRVALVPGGALSGQTTTREHVLHEAARAETLERALRATLRPSDVVAAFAPGVYHVLLPGTNAETATRTVAALESALRAEGFEARVAVEHRAPGAPRVQQPVQPAGDPSASLADESTIDRIAASSINVLILGETGAGKEVMARRLHERSPRADAPLLCLNCAAFTESLLESELFGYEKGAFTGATQSKPGLLEAARGGTVFLDEIGEMPMTLQAKLLRVLEQREVMRIGALRPRPIEVRFLAATNRDLEAESAAGRFRRDLYFRLHGISVVVSPLRERVRDRAPGARVRRRRVRAVAAGRRAGHRPRRARAAQALLVAGQRPRAAQRDGARRGPLYRERDRRRARARRQDGARRPGGEGARSALPAEPRARALAHPGGAQRVPGQPDAGCRPARHLAQDAGHEARAVPAAATAEAPVRTQIRPAAVPGQRICVGINYPWAWNKWGAYFGSGEKVPGDCPHYDLWLSNLDRNLGPIADIVSVVRIFLFGNFSNFGSTKPGAAPEIVRRGGRAPDAPWWSFVPPDTVSPIYAEQLDRMLKIFNKHQVKVIPSLTDAVGFAQGPNAPCRTDIITDPAAKGWFLEKVVDPFVAVSASGDNREAIFAWEVMNEPGQITDSLHVGFLNKTTHPIPREVMDSFLSDVAARFAANGFASTVGHHHAGDLHLTTGDLRQFHYYPQDASGMRRWLVPSELPPWSETRAFLGELQSDVRQFDQRDSVPWPEIPLSSQCGSGRARTVARLRLVEAKGYGLALLWPDLEGPPIDYEPATAAEEPLHFSQPVLDGIREYLDR
jgi:pSer/pThr/pTyr-binding forkhead associated (FHA) protein